MIQQDNIKLKCQKDEHKDEIDTVCFNQFCTEFRLNCLKCIKKGIHHAHFDDVEKINTLIEFMEKKNKECDNLIDDLNQQVQNVNQSFSQLKRGITNKYSLLTQRLTSLNSQQINDVLSSMLQLTEYKQSITTIISEQTKKLVHSFNNLYQQLQLSQFNYYQVDPNDIKQSKELYDKGYKLYWDDQYQQAIQILDKSILLDPNNHLALQCKGACLRLQNKCEEALTWYDKALAIDPKHVYSLSEKGECLRSLKKYDDSQHFIDQALSINPKHTFSLKRKGNCLQDQQKYQEALIYYEKSLMIDPNDEWAKKQKNFCQDKLKQ